VPTVGQDIVALPDGAGPIDVSGILATDDRVRMAGGSEPNGWFAGPNEDPDRYQLLGPGLAGGEGDIWRARYRGHLASPLQVAVKRLRRPASVGEDWPTQNDIRRWEDLRALLLIMRIEHLVSVLDVFVGPAPHPQGRSARDRSTPYVVMEWVPGPTLADQYGGVPAGPTTLDTRLRHVEEVAAALEALHSRTVSVGNPSLHRDVKPTNCILSPARGVVLVDVGTMRLVEDGQDAFGRHTPLYTAPEVLADPTAQRGPASDRYALGALAWFCVTGENPPRAGSAAAAEVALARAQTAARHAGVRDPVALATQLSRMMSPDPQERPSDLRAWAAALRALGVVRRPVSKGLVGSAVAIPLVAVALVLLPLLVLAERPRSDAPDPASMTRAAVPDAVGTGSSTDPWPGDPVTTDVAAFRSPANGDLIGRCPCVEGSADLPTGSTLVLSVENLSAGDHVQHLTPIDGWRKPRSLRRWGTRLPVGLPTDPLGMRYRLELLVVPLAQFRGQEPGPFGPSVPEGSHVAASVFVSRGSQSDEGCSELGGSSSRPRS